MSYHWFNREELLKKAKRKYHNKGGKVKAAEHYQKNKEVIKEKARNKYKNLSFEEKDKKGSIQEISIKNLNKNNSF